MENSRQYILVAGSGDKDVEMEIVADESNVKARLKEIFGNDRAGRLEELDSWSSDQKFFHGEGDYVVGVFPLDGPTPDLVDA